MLCDVTECVGNDNVRSQTQGRYWGERCSLHTSASNWGRLMGGVGVIIMCAHVKQIYEHEVTTYTMGCLWGKCTFSSVFKSGKLSAVVALRPIVPCFMSHALQWPFKQRQVETRTCWSKINKIILEWMLPEDVGWSNYCTGWKRTIALFPTFWQIFPFHRFHLRCQHFLRNTQENRWHL